MFALGTKSFANGLNWNLDVDVVVGVVADVVTDIVDVVIDFESDVAVFVDVPWTGS